MKVVLLTTPGTKNVGNAYINEGGRQLLKKVLPVGTQIYEAKALEMSNSDLFYYPNDCLTEYDRKIIEQADWLFVLGGSCLSSYMFKTFETLKNLKAKKILLGIGFYENLERELEMYKDLPEHFDYIFVRDQETCDTLSQNDKYENIFSSLDMAFWVDINNKIIPEPISVTPYTVVQIDSPIRVKLQEILLDKYPNPYIVRDGLTRATGCVSEVERNHKRFSAERWWEYVRFYCNATQVATNRVHTFLICILAGTPCQPFIDYSYSYERFFLYKQIGLQLETARVYTKEDYKLYMPKLKKMKEETQNILKNIICKK